MKSPALIFYATVLSFILGVGVYTLWPMGLPGIGLVLVMAFGVAVIRSRRSEAPSAPLLLLVSLSFMALSLGMLRSEWASWSVVNPYFESRVDSEVTIEGVIVREPDERETSTHLYIKTDEELVLVIADRYGLYNYGDQVKVTGLLQKPESFETEFGRTFNYPGYLLAKGVSYTVRNARISVGSSGHGWWFIERLLILKHQFMANVESIIPEPQVGLGEGVLLGVKRALGDHLEDVFRRTGIIHIVVLSGYNVMLVVKFIGTILSLVLSKRGQVVFGIAAIASFALLVGLSATVVRASLMAGFLLLAQATGRIYLVTRALLLAGVVMLMLNPYLLIYDVGFQLSFLATMGLIWLMPSIEDQLSFVPSFGRAREFLSATIAAQVAVLPVLLYQIGQFSLVAVVVNVLVLPMVPVAMLLTFLSGLVGFVSSTLALPLAYLAHLSLTYILGVASWFGSWSLAAFVVPEFSFWWVLVGYGFIGYFWYRLNRYQLDPIHDWVIEEERVS